MFLFVAFALCLSAGEIKAQDAEDQKSEEEVKDLRIERDMVPGIIARKLWVDYQGPIDSEPFDFQKWNGGFELGIRYPVNHWLDLAVPVRGSSVTLPESQNNVNVFSLDLQGHFSPLNLDGHLHPYLVTGMGFVLMDGDDFHLAVPAGLGTNIRVNNRVDINLELSYRFGLDDDRDNYQLGIGFIYNLTDREPEKPKSLPEVEEDETVKLPDSDGDGIPDIYDMDPEHEGKLEFLGARDRDGDGVPDHLDRCPDEAGPAENHGCPEEEERPEPVEVEEEEEEVEVVTPTEKEVEVEEVDSDIPEEVQEILEIAMRDVRFDLGRATLRPESFDILNQVANIMSEYPEYNLRIAGHTDNIGSASNNQRLSEQRARSCYEYLASRGVSTARMSFVGYGESRPIDTNETPQGRANNRRVEFNLYLD